VLYETTYIRINKLNIQIKKQILGNAKKIILTCAVKIFNCLEERQGVWMSLFWPRLSVILIDPSTNQMEYIPKLVCEEHTCGAVLFLP